MTSGLTWSALRWFEEYSGLIGAVGVPAVVVGLAFVWLRLSRARRLTAWRRAAAALGLKASSGRQSVALRGTLDGVRVDLVWSRGERSRSANDFRNKSNVFSGAALTVRAPGLPEGLAIRSGQERGRAIIGPGAEHLPQSARGPLERLFILLPDARIDAAGIRGPYRGSMESAALEELIRAAVDAVGALAGR